MTLTGECFCGKVTFQITSPLRNARSCHCSRCRKLYSAQASAYAEVETGSFYWTSGEEALTSVVSEKGYGYRFCSKCGSFMCGTLNGDVHGVALGSLNEDPQIDIGMHIHVASKAAWETISDGVPQYPEFPPQIATGDNSD